MSWDPVFRPGISYLRIPATDPHASADFYEAVFGWEGAARPALEGRRRLRVTEVPT